MWFNVGFWVKGLKLKMINISNIPAFVIFCGGCF